MIPLRKLRQIGRELQRASDLLEAHYPSAAQDWNGSADDLETVRNLDSALAHISGWINCRQNNRRDQYLRAAPPQVKEGGN